MVITYNILCVRDSELRDVWSLRVDSGRRLVRADGAKCAEWLAREACRHACLD